MMVHRVGCFVMLCSVNADPSQENVGMLQIQKYGVSTQEDCSKGGCKPTVDSKVCCKAMTAECLSCSADSTVEEFCRANLKIAGCAEFRPEWTLLARQTYPFMFKKNQWNLNADNPDADNYAILDGWDAYKQNGVYHLKLEWPMNNLKVQEWEQTSNPVQDCKSSQKVWGVQGYEAKNISYTATHWGGLECGAHKHSLLDGSVNRGDWWYAVGSFQQHGGGIPGPGLVIKQVELWIKSGSKICCKAMTADCLSCSAGTTVEEFCSVNPKTTGCPTPAPAPAPAPVQPLQKYEYMGCFQGNSMTRPIPDVANSIVGVQTCRDACSSRGFEYFGFECPHGNGKEVHCECGKGTAAIPGNKALPQSKCEQFNKKSGKHCSGPFIRSGDIGSYSLGAGAIGSVYRTTAQR